LSLTDLSIRTGVYITGGSGSYQPLAEIRRCPGWRIKKSCSTADRNTVDERGREKSKGKSRRGNGLTFSVERRRGAEMRRENQEDGIEDRGRNKVDTRD